MYFSRTRSLSVLIASAFFAVTTTAQTTNKPDLTKQPTLYAVGYAHLDTEWRWEYPQVIDEYLYRTMHDNFTLFDKYPHYIFNFSGANRYRLMKEYYPADFAKVQQEVAAGRWFPAGSSMEEGDVNAPSAEAIIRQVLYGNEWFQKEFGKTSEEFMLPDCFGFPSSLPTILAHAGVKGFSTQKLTWGSSVDAGGPESLEKTPAGTPFNVGVWVGPDGESVVAALNPGAYSGRISTDLSAPLPELPPNPALEDVRIKLADVQRRLQASEKSHSADPKDIQKFIALRTEQAGIETGQRERVEQRFQGDWASRVLNNGKVTGLFTDYHYYGTGDIGGAPDEESVKRLEAIVTQGSVDLPPQGVFNFQGQNHSAWPSVPVGAGPVHVISATADQMFRDITPEQASALPRYTGEMELTNHSAGSLTSQAYQKRWIRKEELLADAAEKSSVAAAWLGARSYPLARLNDAWTLAMGAHFHDLAAGTATPRSYEFAWNDDVIGMNQFADVLSSSVEGVSAGLNTEGEGVPVVVFNPLNILRKDVVEAQVDYPGGLPKAVHVVGPDGISEPAQISDGKILFEATVPSVGYSVFHVMPGAADATPSELRVTNNELENAYYKVLLNTDGDVASIFDKQAQRELLASPARLALSYDNPEQWPAWNMDWEQEQAKPTGFVSGPAKVRIVEDGPVRVALEVTRETAGSKFVQTVLLSAGDAGKRIEFGNVIDWNTRETNLKATFPLTATNEMATYNWGIGTIQRPTAQPKKFEVPSHQWIDLTDMSGTFGATILTDSKNGSDKPNDSTIRLTLIRTPGTAGGYSDQATQDIGHHEFTYGIAGHVAGWRNAETDWQAERLNDPLIAFESPKHAGELGRTFSVVKVSNARIKIMALKKAEASDEYVIRLVELDGKPQTDVRITFAAPVTSAREVNGQEQQLRAANVVDGALVTSFGAYQPRAFAVKLAAPNATIPDVQSAPVTLHYAVATASDDGDASKVGFDGKGNALPAEMLPAQVAFNGVSFHLAQAKTGSPNAIVAKGQKIELPAGIYDRVYILAASANGDQKVTFEVGGKKHELNVEDWGGFIGQWDDRQWSSASQNDNYGDMVGLKPGFIKRADLAWYSTHHHDAAGKNVAYSYSYLFGYGIDLPAGSRTIKLPDNPNVRILAISVANENPLTRPVQPLYDVLPSPNAGVPDFSLTVPRTVSVSQGMKSTNRILVMPRGGFNSKIKLSASGLPEGVTATFDPEVTTGSSTLTLRSTKSVATATTTITVSGQADKLSQSATTALSILPVLPGTVPVNMSSAYNVIGIYTDGSKFEVSASLDAGGYSFSEKTLGSEQVGDEVVFNLGPPNAPDAVTSKTVDLPSDKFVSIKILATAVEGNQDNQVFTVNYADGTSSSFTQTVSDWSGGGDVHGESLAVQVPYRLSSDGSTDSNPFNLFAYSFSLDSTKQVKSVTLPENRNVAVYAMTLVPLTK